MYERIKRWFALGLWTEPMVRAACDKGLLTTAEYENILKREDPN